MIEKTVFTNSFTFKTWCKIIVSTFLLFIGINYYINKDTTSTLLIFFFSFLASWITWRDLKGYIIKDYILVLVFAGLSYSLNFKPIFEYFITAILLGSFVMIADYLSTGYRFNTANNNQENLGRNIQKLYFGSAGYLIGWTQATIILLIAYMMFPIENNVIYHSMLNGWNLFIESILYPIILCSILIFIVLIQHHRKKAFESKHIGIIYYKNIRIHTVWFLAFFGALLGFPISLAIMLFSFILYIPAYLIHFFHLKISDLWIEENIIKFFSYKRKKI